MNFTRRRLAISTMAWVVLAVVIVMVGGSAAYFGSYSAVKASSPNPTTTTIVQLEVSDTTTTLTNTVTATSTASASTANSALNGTLIAIEFFYLNAGQTAGIFQYSVSVLNNGQTTISPPSSAQLYFTDVTSGITFSATCSIYDITPPAGSFSCTGDTPSGISAGDVVDVKVVTQDGASAVSSSRVSSRIQLVTISLSAGTTGSGSTSATSELSIALNDPSSATWITSLNLTQSKLSSPISSWGSTSSASSSINFSSNSGLNALQSNSIYSATFYPLGQNSESIVKGSFYNYVIVFANGQSISGSIIAQ